MLAPLIQWLEEEVMMAWRPDWLISRPLVNHRDRGQSWSGYPSFSTVLE
jgi:hypothetical protein